MSPELCLGTAQFGLRYGITNKAGQVSKNEAAELLNEATRSKIKWLDTAQAYGNSETVLGKILDTSHSFKIVSKLAQQPQPHFCEEDSINWEKAFKKSCTRLGVKKLDVLLLHRAGDLMKTGNHHLKNWLSGLRDRGLVERIGVSIYSKDELKGIEERLLDVVQLPLSVFDQRMLENGTIDRLRDRGTAIHARSIYLQGLLLTPAGEWPDWVSTKVRAHQKSFEKLAQRKKCRLIDLALGFAKEQKDVECIVLGICNMRELQELQKTWLAEPAWQKDEWRHWAIRDSDILDPRNWPR